ncbi:PKD domain-containing protein [Candidatus Saccharibacteria bacterium]|nr:PKD domain-containing protein [Candidatus Saccharibacteria bacterium]
MLGAEHNLRLRAHSHTSYPGLLFALLLTGVIVLGASIGAQGAVQNPQSGSVGLTGTVPGPAPTQPGVITSPSSGSHTTSSPITVAGTCPANTFVFIEKNGVLAGQAACNGGSFSLQADLFAGSNQLVARVVDGLGQYGPDSAAITVVYDQPTSQTAGIAVGRQLFIESGATVVAGEPNTALAREVRIVGGTAPYAVSWDFGDGSNSLMTVAVEGPVSALHTYTSPGTYQVLVRVTDSLQNAAFIQLITVVNGPIAAVTGSSTQSELPGSLVAAWPLLGLAIFLVGAFWLGERRAMHRQMLRDRLRPVV